MFTLLVGMTTASLAFPACPSSGYFHNCYGTYTFVNGNKYGGEYKNSKRNGLAIYIYPNGVKKRMYYERMR